MDGFLDFLHFNQDLLFYYFHNMDPVSELRQRRKEEDEGTTVPNRSITKRLEKLDIYPKIGDDYVVKTESGGYGMYFYKRMLIS